MSLFETGLKVWFREQSIHHRNDCQLKFSCKGLKFVSFYRILDITVCTDQLYLGNINAK